MVSAERLRLDRADTGGVPWQRWGPYLSERQWGTVREDYGSGDNTWSYFPHEQARSRAYRWGEDGLAGVSDDRQQLRLALGLWNGHDPILKERLFGLTNAEGIPLLFRGISAEALRTGGRGAIKSAAAGRRTGAAR